MNRLRVKRLTAACGATAMLVALMATTGAAGNAGMSTEADQYYDPRQEGAVESLVSEMDMDRSAASEILRDQELLSIHLSEYGGADEIRVDVGVDGKQTIFVNSADEELVIRISEITFEASTVVPEVWPSTKMPGEKVTLQLMEALPGMQGMYVDPGTGALVLDVFTPTDGHVEVGMVGAAEPTAKRTDGSSSPEAARDLSLAEAERVISEVFDLQNVVIEPMDSAVQDSIVIRGGNAMSHCTAGFAARRSGYIGFLTADHCKSATQNVFEGRFASGSSVAATHRASSNRQNADIAFYSVGSNNSLISQIWTGPGLQVINANGVATVGMTACHQGKITGHGCGKVQSITYKPTYAGACAPFATCNATFVSVSAREADGDSGGPWHVGSADLGIHKGGNGNNFSIYSKLGYAPLYLAP